jgi:hypothetical protein
VGWQPVRCHPEAVARGAAHHDVIDGAVRAGEGKAFGDLGRDIAVRARYDGQHRSASGYMWHGPWQATLPIKNALAGMVMPIPPAAATGPGAGRAGGGTGVPLPGGGQH